MVTQTKLLSQMPKAWSLARAPTFPILKKHPNPPGSNHRQIVGSRPVQLKAAIKEAEVARRSGNYQPSVWDYNLFQSYTSAYNINDEEQMKKIERLKEDVNSLLWAKMEPLAKLELIDSIQRLGLEYHFEKEIATAIDSLYYHDAQHPSWTDGDLYTTALKFRIFRQKGLLVSEDVFKCFKEKHEEFKRTALHEDVKVLLSLYEASFLGYEDEAGIDEIKTYAATGLKNLLQGPDLLDFWAKSVDHALDMPLHWRLNRMEANWYIDVYEKEEHMNPSLLHLAKLDYNIVQSTYLQEVQELIRWWLDMGLDNISFARDRALEHYLWSSAMIHEPQFRDARIGEAKIASLITLVDDVYDVYGSIQELELFTDIVNRWDISRVDELPPPVRTVLLAMFNTSNEIGYKCIKKNGFNGTRFMSKAWANLCNAYMQEAKWYHGGYIPTLDEYLRTAMVSISGPLMLSGFYVLSTDKVRDEALKYIQDVQCVVRCCATNFRLTNDLGTSKDELARGDVMKAVECYMNEAGVGEAIAREHVIELVERNWKIVNKAITGSYPLPETFIRASQNLVKISQYFYKNGDGHGINPGDQTKERLMTLLLRPVPMD